MNRYYMICRISKKIIFLQIEYRRVSGNCDYTTINYFSVGIM
ncbi:hypothetical protein [Fusobacterium hominis]|nr:hypothetical protein [Fusobacterium hominis]